MLPTVFILLVFLLATHATSHRRPRHRLVRRDTPGWAYVDCVNDGPARALTGYLISDKANTIDKCIATCADRGFVYAGMQYGSQCSCGNTLANGLGTVPQTNGCTYSCPGSTATKCGGYYQLSLYQKTALSISSLGCYQGGSSRAFAAASDTSSNMSLNSCAAFCSANGLDWFGVEYGSQCYCSATAPSDGKISDSRCDMKCSANDGTICGGSYAMSVYSVKTVRASPASSPTSVASSLVSTASSRSTTQTASPTASSVTSLGCFSDSSTNRLLQGPKQSVQQNTPSFCMAWCAGQGYALSGVEFGSECYCGTAYDTSRAASASSCRYACSGDASQFCGGYGVMNLYRGVVAPTSTSASASATASSTAPSGLSSLGCYQDGTTRIFDGPSKRDSLLTPGSCATWCMSQGYTVIGLEYGSECYCASSVPTAARTEDARCTYSCGGDKTVTCGGSYLADVYRIGDSCNGCAVQIGAAKPPLGGNKLLWAHHMVGNTYSYTPATWADDIAQAAAAGFDGFALNHGATDWQFDRMADAYAAAAKGSFKLFLSIDVTAIGCSSASDAQHFANIILTYANYSSQAVYKNKTLVSTFAGDNCFFGQGSAQAGWTYMRQLVRAGGKEIYLIPAIFIDPSRFASMTWFDGLFNWDSAWPVSGGQLTTASDETWMSNLGTRGYMAAISPLFFTYYGPSSWNKVWIYRSDDWLLARRFEQLIAMRNRIDMAELVTWNDYGESHYVGPIRVDQPNSQGWVNGYPHTAWLSMIKYYAYAFKTGNYPAITVDQMWLWTRPHPKDANPTNPTVRRPDHWETTDDNLYALVLLTGPASVRVFSGSNEGNWELPAGISKIRIASAVGTIGGEIRRAGRVVKSFDSEGQFKYTTTPVDFNYNYWLGSM